MTRENNDKLTCFSNTKFQRHQINSLEEEVLPVEAKLMRVTTKRLKMERGDRAAISLARSLDSHATNINMNFLVCGIPQVFKESSSSLNIFSNFLCLNS